MNQAAAAKPPPSWALLLSFGIIYISWGTTYQAIKIGVQEEHMPPLLFGGVRICLGGIMLLGYQLVAGAPLRLARRDALRLFGVSLLLFVAGNGFIGYAQKTVDASVAAVLVATVPLWIGLFTTFWPHGERLTPRGWAGLAVGLAGVIVLLTPKLLDAQQPFDAFGFLMVLGSAGSWALGSVLLRHARVAVPHLTAATWQMLMGGATMLIVGLAMGESKRWPQSITSGAVVAFLYLLLVGSLGGFIAFNFLLGHVSAAKVGTYAYVNPFVAVLVGWAFGEQVTWGLWAGMGVILFGVFLVRGGERPAPPAETQT